MVWARSQIKVPFRNRKLSEDGRTGGGRPGPPSASEGLVDTCSAGPRPTARLVRLLPGEHQARPVPASTADIKMLQLPE